MVWPFPGKIYHVPLCYVSDLLDELQGVQQGFRHLMGTYQLKVGPLTQLKYSDRMIKRTVESLKATNQLIQMENN